MFGFLRARSDRIDTLIGPGIRVDGDLSFTGGLRIDGEVRGNVVAAPDQPSVLVIGATGRVEGDSQGDADGRERRRVRIDPRDRAPRAAARGADLG